MLYFLLLMTRTHCKWTVVKSKWTECLYRTRQQIAFDTWIRFLIGTNVRLYLKYSLFGVTVDWCRVVVVVVWRRRDVLLSCCLVIVLLRLSEFFCLCVCVCVCVRLWSWSCSSFVFVAAVLWSLMPYFCNVGMWWLCQCYIHRWMLSWYVLTDDCHRQVVVVVLIREVGGLLLCVDS